MRVAPYLLSVCIWAFLNFSAPPALASAADELEETQGSLREAEARQAELEEKRAKLQKELDELQKQLVPSAGNVQKYEAELSATEDKLSILDDQLAQKEAALEAARTRQAVLVQAALRLSRTPPQAALLMPGSQVETMKVARALEMTTQSLRQEAEGITLQVKELQGLRKKVAKSRENIREKNVALTQEQAALRARVEQRKELQKALGKQQKEESEKISKLAKRAEDLQQLLTTLAEEKRRKELREQSANRQMKKPRTSGHKVQLRSFADAKGAIRPPVAGKLVLRYGRKDENGAVNKGLVITSREGAQVTAPYDGEVVFAGPFLQYGRMVILRHSDEFHTLLSGLTRIDVAVGEFLLEGEPIGAMGDSKSATRLYVELRKNNQPIDPAPWIKGIKK
jgi:septal ring factor EnvC (AmiA/AmiB activator)